MIRRRCLLPVLVAVASLFWPFRVSSQTTQSTADEITDALYNLTSLPPPSTTENETEESGITSTITNTSPSPSTELLILAATTTSVSTAEENGTMGTLPLQRAQQGGVRIRPSGLCDFCLDEGEGNFSSYGYPLPYRGDLDCTFRVKRVDDSCELDLIFHDFDLEEGDRPESCYADYLAIDRTRYCGRQLKGKTETVPFPPEQSELTFYFHTDSEVSAKGFWIEVQRKPGTCPSTVTPSTCDATFTTSDVTLSSPSYPSEYGTDLECRYRFRRSSADVCGLEVSFLAFDVEQSDACIYDYLEINGERICGTLPEKAIKVFMFNEPEKVIRFVSDRQTTRTGFNLRVRQITDCYPENGENTSRRDPRIQDNALPPPPACAFCTEEERGELTSYGFPDDYRNNLLCTYVIDRRAPSFCRVELRFLDFDVHYTNGCRSDYLLLDGQRYCGDQLAGQNVYVAFKDQGHINMVFQTDNATVRHGFHLRFRQLPCYEPLVSTEVPGDCDQVFHQSSFTLESPGHPDSYANNQDCRYLIRKTSDRVCKLLLTFVVFDVEAEGATCDSDYLEIDSEKFCGTLPAQEQKIVPFLEAEKALRFHSDGATTRPGFLVRVEQRECPTSTTTPSGSEGKAEARTTPSTQPRTPEPPVYNCDQVVQGERETDLFSPNYPSNYPNNADCAYTIRKVSSDICRVQIVFRDFEIQAGDVCQYDYLQANNFRLCGSTPDGTERVYEFVDEEFPLSFRSDNNVTERGFHVTLRQLPCSTTSSPSSGSSCDATTDEEEFELTSPNYPDSYDDKLDCRYVVQKRSPNICALELTFSDFKLEADDACAADYLEVDDQRYCGTLPFKTMRTFSFTEEQKSIYFHSNDRSVDFGFRIGVRQVDCESTSTVRPKPTTRRPFTTQRPLPTTTTRRPSSRPCNEVLSAREFELTSPYFPDRYPNNLDCTYTVIKASPEVCELKIQVMHFDLESSSGCEYDYLLVDGERLCGTLAQGVTRIYDFRNRRKVLRFRSDAASSRSGFHVRFRQLSCRGTAAPQAVVTTTAPRGGEPVLCDRVFTGRQFQLRSENYPDDYSSDLECRYTVRKASTSICRLEVTFVRFDVESSDACQYDYLEIDQNRFCGLIPANTKRSFTFLPFEKVIRFRSDSGTNRPGFMLSVRQVDCSATTTPQPECSYRYTATSGRFQGYLSRTDPRSCTYRVEAASKSFCHVELSFARFRLGSPARDECVTASNYLEINGVRYCGQQLDGHTRTVAFEEKLGTVVLQLVSDGDGGFDLAYRQVPCTPRPPVPVSPRPPQPSIYCDRLLGSPEFQIRNPDYPVDYVDPVNCRFTVPRVGGRFCRLRLRFQVFDVASDNGCSTDYLEIKGQRICGKLAPGTIREYDFTSGPEPLMIKFHAEGGSRSRFVVEGEQMDCRGLEDVPEPDRFRPRPRPGPRPDRNCDRMLGGEQFEVFSPGYPSGYPEDLNCRYIILRRDPAICGLELTFVEFQVEDSYNCQNDYLSIQERRLCGSLPPGTTRTYDFFASDKVLYFHSDHDVSRAGFHIRGKQVWCRNLPAIAPNEEIPPVPIPRPAPPSCDRTFFDAEFVVESPEYPAPYPTDIECRWTVKRTDPDICALDVTFLNFDVEEDPACRYDFLQIEGDRRLCGKILQGTQRRYEFLYPSREIRLVFRSDRATTRPGFALRLRQSRDCGPEARNPVPWMPMGVQPPCEVCRREAEGVIVSPGYPREGYPGALRCRYHVEKLPGRCAVELFFEDFDVQPSEECRKDFLALESSNVDGGRRYCGTTLSGMTKVFSFPWNEPSQFDMDLVTDDEISGRGFRIQFRQLPCRGSRHLNSSTTLVPPTVGITESATTPTSMVVTSATYVVKERKP